MGRRIEVELTSNREDGSWTWRAAGAKQPKGDVAESLLYDGAKVGDVVKVEAEFHLDGIEVTEVFAPRQKKERTDLLELKSRPLRDDELVTTQRVARSDRRGDRRGGRGRARGEGRGDRGERRGPRPEPERRPKPKRLRPKRAHRDALLAEVTEEHRPIVEQVIRDGMPGVRAAIEKQNAEAKAAGKPEIDPSPILAIAEKNLGAARLAEWRDRADAALADGAELDIRDLRSVVVAGSDVARDDETRALVDQIKELLDQRLESDHANWLQDLDAAVTEGRVVRGLRLSSRPVKAGAPLPTEVASKLAEQASQALAPDVAQDRWATVLDALAFSPVRAAVTPVGLPAEPGEELVNEVRRLSDRIPTIAQLFGIDPAQVPRSAKRRRSPRRDGGRGGRNQGQGGPRKDRNRPVPGAEKKAETPSSEQPAPPAADAAPAEAAPSETIPTTPTETTPTEATSSGTAAATPTEAGTGAVAPSSAEIAPSETPAETTPADATSPAGDADDTPSEAATEVPATEAGAADDGATGDGSDGGAEAEAPAVDEPAAPPSVDGDGPAEATVEAPLVDDSVADDSAAAADGSETESAEVPANAE